MIISLLILATFVYAGVMVFMPNSFKRTLLIAVSFIVIAGSLSALVLNDNYHWGMRQVSTTRTETLRPLQSKQRALGIKHLGTGTERVILYRTTASAKVQKTTTAATTTKLATGSTAHVKTTTTRWVYRNQTTKVLFNLGKTNHQFASRHYTFVLPIKWHSMTIKTTK
ncbi:DUF4811 domain-containing protein [Lactiplantibacillus daoliensis]|uniref:DUF4811 domain-containing protein n=1 Tax=Lactiplantibacillus daoliensis TaxID=2559916 RepID=A0ABW1UHI3_9LACO|nr:DUF4811 domain-containing protein [Lactiplantibacillus daoliensis]